MADISREELDRLYKTLDDGFKGVHSRLDRVNGTVGEHTVKIAVLEERAHPAIWGGGVGACVAAVAEIGRWFFTK